ncbi:cuticle protein 67-like [Cephus cinctus]|uniref:Cuticle protein 67-like n=2 Tax=Cephus cinctus TaxID=211228 RepID=A0AAJ7BQY5_CEPCN|nr:cuticle protein 67-like [Cephus cinctus]
MSLKFVILACAVAAANAGYLGAPVAQYAVPHALTATSDNILRSPGNLAQVATQTKTISTPYSSSSKSDIRVSNPGVYAHAAPLAYAHAPVAHAAPLAYAHAPVVHGSPLAYSAGPVAPSHLGLSGLGYSPAVAVSHVSYSSPVGVSYGW